MLYSTKKFLIRHLNFEQTFDPFYPLWNKTSTKGTRKKIGLLHKKFEGKNALSASIQGEQAS